MYSSALCSSQRTNTQDWTLLARARASTRLRSLSADWRGTARKNKRRLSRLLVVLSRLLELDPGLIEDRRDRGFVAMRLGSRDVAESDLRRYLELAPEAGDAAEVRRLLSRLKGRPTRTN
jgi:regulator of sirC expression with transglutaminase-like and TPR domain